MPALDGTGPAGQGPRTGRGAGNCDPNDGKETAQTRRPRRGVGRCGNGIPRGGGRGRAFGGGAN